jgi:hypothetical protein
MPDKCAQLLGFDHKVYGKTEAESLQRSWDVLQYLSLFYGIEFQCILKGTNVVTHKPENQDRYWSLSDNGGEVNVELINSDKRTISVPSTSCRFYVTAETIAYRIMCAITDRAIIWDLKVEETITLQDLKSITPNT